MPLKISKITSLVLHSNLSSSETEPANFKSKNAKATFFDFFVDLGTLFSRKIRKSSVNLD